MKIPDRLSQVLKTALFFREAPASFSILKAIAVEVDQHMSDAGRQDDRLLIVAKGDGAVLYDLDQSHAIPMGNIDMDAIVRRFDGGSPAYDVTAELAVEGYLVVASRPVDGVTFAYNDRILMIPPRASVSSKAQGLADTGRSRGNTSVTG